MATSIGTCFERSSIIANIGPGRGASAYKVGGTPVFHFRTKAPAPTAEVPARYTRAGYLHPVFTPSGLA